MFPVLVLLIFTTTQALVPLRQKTALSMKYFQRSNSSSGGASVFLASPNKGNISSDVSGKTGCKYCKRPPYMSVLEYKIRIDEAKAKILQALRLTEPPKIQPPKDFKIPPPLLKRFQEARRQQKEKEQQEERSISEVVLFGHKCKYLQRFRVCK